MPSTSNALFNGLYVLENRGADKASRAISELSPSTESVSSPGLPITDVPSSKQLY